MLAQHSAISLGDAGSGAARPRPGAAFYTGGKGEQVVLLVVNEITLVIEEEHSFISNSLALLRFPC